MDTTCHRSTLTPLTRQLLRRCECALVTARMAMRAKVLPRVRPWTPVALTSCVLVFQFFCSLCHSHAHAHVYSRVAHSISHNWLCPCVGVQFSSRSYGSSGFSHTHTHTHTLMRNDGAQDANDAPPTQWWTGFRVGGLCGTNTYLVAKVSSSHIGALHWERNTIKRCVNTRRLLTAACLLVHFFFLLLLIQRPCERAFGAPPSRCCCFFFLLSRISLFFFWTSVRVMLMCSTCRRLQLSPPVNWWPFIVFIVFFFLFSSSRTQLCDCFANRKGDHNNQFTNLC